ncbi:MAG TPA: MBL fold metallo-hydrolase [Rubricoccaceae bacterium]|jgi:beta-lactamase superfamily II metal-dependent hydrolase
MDTAFAGYSAPFIYESPVSRTKVQQLLWGDFVTLLGERNGSWVRVRGRGEEGWMNEADLQPDRLLEVYFVDVGQGDGAFIITPDDRRIVVDAGEVDNLFRFLSWRFALRRDLERVVDIDAVVITHPDQDHYGGFDQFFQSRQFRIGSVYHNGIVERDGPDRLGPTVPFDGRTCLSDLVVDRPALDARLALPGWAGRLRYPNLLKRAAERSEAPDIRMLSARDEHLPGYELGQPLHIRVLAPVEEADPGQRLLRTFASNDGKTKNGHSIVLKLEYGNIRILLGGDLNTPAEEHLLAHYTGLDPRPQTGTKRDTLVTQARKTFEADVAKACHHGAADFTNVFVQAVNALATVVSSGDAESHCHPRPDALGAMGRWGRGDRPLVFSTELARSTNDRVRNPQALRDEIARLFDEREAAAPVTRSQVQGRIDEKLGELERSVAVYGLINLRTDGKRVVMAQKLEEPRPGSGEKWDVHRLEPDASGDLQYVSKF